MQIEILYSDNPMLVCVKPSGILSQSDGQTDLPAILKMQEHLSFAHPAHRLDREAGGLIVVAKSAEVAAKLSESLKENHWEKTYLAILKGIPAVPAGKLHDLLYHDARRNKSFVVDHRRKGVRDAELYYKTLAQYNEYTLVSIRLFTGRTHQIRVQFASRGMPLVGDGRYGGGGGTMALWSAMLSLPHPLTGEQKSFYVSPPTADPWTMFSDLLMDMKPCDIKPYDEKVER